MRPRMVMMEMAKARRIESKVRPWESEVDVEAVAVAGAVDWIWSLSTRISGVLLATVRSFSVVEGAAVEG